MINYKNILSKNMLNVFIDILKYIKKNGLSDGNHIYITFLTNHKRTIIPNWLKEKYTDEMTIIIQYEYYNLNLNKDSFEVTLSFNNIKADLKIPYESILSFADPSSNFGLKLKENKKNKKIKTTNKKTNNVIEFSNYKKN
tara:strand:+ start:18 stop:437 length:420 start_codon:yes stop_codon:yes gene_type:complete